MTVRLTYIHISDSFYLIGSELIGRVSKCLLATSYNAYLGHPANHINVEQFITDGNFLHLNLKESPTGDIHKTTCKFSRMLFIKIFQSIYGLSAFLSLAAIGRTKL